jgi:hypothetical protein
MGNCSTNLPVSAKFMAERNALVQEIAYCENLLKKYYDEKTHVDLSNNVSEIKHILNCIPAHVVNKNDIIIKIEKSETLLEQVEANITIVNKHIRNLRGQLDNLDTSKSLYYIKTD